MALLDHNTESEFPFNKEEVFNAILKAIPLIKGFRMETQDKMTGRIFVKSKLSLFSWGENIPIQLSEISSGKTKVSITSTPKTGLFLGGAFDFGKNRRNLEAILSATSQILQSGDSSKVIIAKQKGGCLKIGLIIAGIIIIIAVVISIMNNGTTDSNTQQQSVENQVATDAVKQYEMVKKNGTAIEAYTQAGVVAAVFLQAQDSVNYAKWEKIEHEEAKRAGVPE